MPSLPSILFLLLAFAVLTLDSFAIVHRAHIIPSYRKQAAAYLTLDAILFLGFIAAAWFLR